MMPDFIAMNFKAKMKPGKKICLKNTVFVSIQYCILCEFCIGKNRNI